MYNYGRYWWGLCITMGDIGDSLCLCDDGKQSFRLRGMIMLVLGPQVLHYFQVWRIWRARISTRQCWF